MTRITRRTALAGTAGLAAGLAAAFAIRPAFAAGGQVRIGYQKYGTLVLLKGRGILEKQLEPLGVTVSWAEFAAGRRCWRH